MKKTFQNFRKHLILQVFFQIPLKIYCWSCVLETFVNVGFLGKEMFSFRKNTWKFSKTLNTDIFLQNAFQKLLLLMQSPTVQNLSFFERKWRFMRKNPWKTSGVLFGISYRDCVSDFHSASEFSNQSKFWFAWRNRCCLWKDPCFPLESVNVAFFSKLAFQKKIKMPKRTENVQQLEISGKVDWLFGKTA